MAEAAVEQPSSRFFCHQCSGEICPVLPGFTCPQCDSGFIEEISPELEEERRETEPESRSDHNPIADALFDIWGRHFLTSLGAINSSNSSVPDLVTDSSSSSSSGASDDDVGQSEAAGRTTTTTSTSSNSSSSGAARTRSSRDSARVAQARLLLGGDSGGSRPRPGSGEFNPFLQGMITNILQNLTQSGGGGGAFHIPISVGGGGGGMTGFPMNMFQIHGNSGDYAWGPGGLDAIISQLLNQLDGSGAPPAPRETIDNLPFVKITQQQVDIKLQCSVCMDDYILDESVQKLPCEHLFHENCIVPWLELHGTCPVCRKGLNEDDASNTGEGTDDDGSGDRGGGRNSQAGLDRFLRGNGGNINVIFAPRGSSGGGTGGTGGGSGGSGGGGNADADTNSSTVFNGRNHTNRVVTDDLVSESIDGGDIREESLVAHVEDLRGVTSDPSSLRELDLVETGEGETTTSSDEASMGGDSAKRREMEEGIKNSSLFEKQMDDLKTNRNESLRPVRYLV